MVYTDESRRTSGCAFPALRQQWERDGQTSFRSLADYLAPRRPASPTTWVRSR